MPTLQAVNEAEFNAFLAETDGLTAQEYQDPDRPQTVYTDAEGVVQARAVAYNDHVDAPEGAACRPRQFLIPEAPHVPQVAGEDS